MRAVVDTNVLVSGILFGGAPGRVLTRWRYSAFQWVASPRILDEYWRISRVFSARHPGVDFLRIVDLIALGSVIVAPRRRAEQICRDPDDDELLLCAAAGGALLVTGDKELHVTDGALDVRVVTPGYRRGRWQVTDRDSPVRLRQVRARGESCRSASSSHGQHRAVDQV